MSLKGLTPPALTIGIKKEADFAAVVQKANYKGTR